MRKIKYINNKKKRSDEHEINTTIAILISIIKMELRELEIKLKI